MRKILIISILGIIFCSCQPKYSVISRVQDYSKYTNNGFTIAQSDCVAFDYQSISFVSIEEKSGKVNPNSIYAKSKGVHLKYDVLYKDCSVENALDLFVEECKSLGADGAIDLKISYLENNKKHTYKSNPSIIVTGLAIKRIK